MKRKILFATAATVIALSAVTVADSDKSAHGSEHSDHLTSPYQGQTDRKIKALSAEDIQGLLDGAGTPFGGMAKPAELNGYPGPRHVLEAHEAGQISLTQEQLSKTQKLFDEMRAASIPLGEKIIAIETEIDNRFVAKEMTEAFMREKIAASTELYRELRFNHLKYHLYMVDILTPQQIERYNEVRGYTSSDPCENVPEGHSEILWKLHNHCS